MLYDLNIYIYIDIETKPQKKQKETMMLVCLRFILHFTMMLTVGVLELLQWLKCMTQ